MSRQLKQALLLATLAGIVTGAAHSNTEPKPCAPIVAEDAPPVAEVLPQPTPQQIRNLRVAKATYIVSHLYYFPDRRYFGPYVRALINEHEYLEARAISKGKPGNGYGDAWFWSLVYGGANFSLKCHTRAPGNCYGPLDVKQWPLVTDPIDNIAHHCQEMLTGYYLGYRDRELCEYVMYPPAPHDWGAKRNKKTGRYEPGMFVKTEAKHRKCIAEGYAAGKIGATQP